MDMRTPLSRVTGLGTAGGEATNHFWHQRLTALANVPLTLFLVYVVASLYDADRATIVSWFSNPFVAGLMILTIISVCWHFRLGIQVVVEDYVHGGAKTATIILNNLFASGLAILMIAFVFKLSFGG